MARFDILLVTILIAFATNSHYASAHNSKQSKWAKTIPYGHEHKTTLQFYFHDNITGDSLTAIKIAYPDNASPDVSGFGKLFMADEPLTLSPDPQSKSLGRAQGMWGDASLKGDVNLYMSFTYFFTEGIYNGSSFSVLGRNPIFQTVREMPVVGGTGLFRMARGYALAQTKLINLAARNAVVGYNVTIFHE